MSKTKSEKVELGDRVKDKASGLEGMAVAYTKWRHGCLRWAIQPPVGKDNKKPTEEWIDDPDCEVVEKAVTEDTTPTGIPPRHGPRDDSMQQVGARY